MQIIQARSEHLPLLTPLFNAYRMFYGQASDPSAAENFLRARMQQEESVIFLAFDGEKLEEMALGFVQLYPSFSSVSMQRIWILNDLFVDGQARKRGVATQLIERSHQLVVETGAKGLLLETSMDNRTAQRVYERIGFNRVNESYYYFLPVRT